MRFNIPSNSSIRLTEFRLACERFIEAKFYLRRHHVFSMTQNTGWITVASSDGALFLCAKRENEKRVFAFGILFLLIYVLATRTRHRNHCAIQTLPPIDSVQNRKDRQRNIISPGKRRFVEFNLQEFLSRRCGIRSQQSVCL